MITYAAPTPAALVVLRRHVRRVHANLLGDPTSWQGYAPLPQTGLSGIPGWLVLAVHKATHAGLYSGHLDDDWRPLSPADADKWHVIHQDEGLMGSAATKLDALALFGATIIRQPGPGFYTIRPDAASVPQFPGIPSFTLVRGYDLACRHGFGWVWTRPADDQDAGEADQ